MPRRMSRSAAAGMTVAPCQRWTRTNVTAATNGTSMAAIETNASGGSSAHGLPARIPATCVLSQ